LKREKVGDVTYYQWIHATPAASKLKKKILKLVKDVEAEKRKTGQQW